MDENKELTENGLPEGEPTVSYVLQQIAELQRNVTDLDIAVTQIVTWDNDKTQTFRDAVMARETTNQKLLDFYAKVYEDIRPQNAGDKRKFIIDLINNVPHSPGMQCPDYAAIIRVANEVTFDLDWEKEGT